MRQSIVELQGRVFRRFALGTFGVLLFGLAALASIQHYEKRTLIDTQGSYFAKSVRSELIQGKKSYVYEICRSIFSDSSIFSVTVIKDNQTICDMQKQIRNPLLSMKSENPILFDPKGDISSSNTAGIATITIDANAIAVTVALTVVLFIISFILFLTFARKSHDLIEQELILPLREFSKTIGTFPLNADRIKEINRKTSLAEIFDLTSEYIKLREKLKIAEKKIKIEARKSVMLELSRKLAHDIRAPISVLQALIRKIDPIDSPSKNSISKVICRINSIADDLLDETREFNRPSPQGRHQYEKIKVEEKKSLERQTDINSCISDIIDERSGILGTRKRINYRVYAGRIARTSAIDRPKLERLLSNLIQNAEESIDGEGFISVSTETVVNNLIIEIRDSGRGISEKNLEILNSTPRTIGKEKGNGIGLRSAKEYLSSIGGDLKLFSQQKRGTTVRLQIPLVQHQISAT